MEVTRLIKITTSEDIYFAHIQIEETLSYDLLDTCMQCMMHFARIRADDPVHAEELLDALMNAGVIINWFIKHVTPEWDFEYTI